MATIEVLQNLYITDEVTEEHMDCPASISRGAALKVVLAGHTSAVAPQSIEATVRLQHADALDGPYATVPGCSLVFSGPGSSAHEVVTVGANVLKEFLAPQNFANGAADGGATILLVQ